MNNEQKQIYSIMLHVKFNISYSIRIMRKNKQQVYTEIHKLQTIIYKQLLYYIFEELSNFLLKISECIE